MQNEEGDTMRNGTAWTRKNRLFPLVDSGGKMEN